MKPFYSTKLALLIAILSGFSWNANAQTTTFTYTGGVQTFAVPAGVTVVSADCRGASGGNNYYSSGGAPGGGGRVQCLVNVTGISSLSVYVGQQGTTGVSSNATTAGGGDGGGGAGGGVGTHYGGGGGGATDIRPVGGGLASRIVVAGAGGGAGYGYGTDNGGGGGNLIGANGASSYSAYGGSGGTQTAGGAGAEGDGSPGAFGPGGNGYTGYLGYSEGGGGGGWYGGGGAFYDAGGGGGSSYTSPTYVSSSSVILTQGYNAVGNGVCMINIPPPGGSITPSTLSYGPIVVGTVSPSQCVTISFYNLSPASGTGGVGGTGLIITPPPGFLASVDGVNFYPAGSVPALAYSGGGITAPVCFEFAPSSYAIYSASATISGGGIPVPLTVSLSGTGVFPCYGTPTGGTASSSVGYSNPTTPFTLSASGESVGGGVTYQWLSSPYPTFGFTNIVGATNNTYAGITGISATTYYELVTTCPGSGLSGASAVATVQDTSTAGLSPCFGFPVAGTVSPDVAGACAPYVANLSYRSSSTATGLLYQWQSSPDNVTFTPVTGATNNYYSTTVTGLMYYNLIVTCNNSGLSATTASTSVNLLTVPTPITGSLPVCNPIPSLLTSSPTGGSWTSSVPSVATVGLGSGIVMGTSSGTTVITYTLPDGCSTNLMVNVSPAPVAITGSASVCNGSATTAFFDGTPSGRWTSSNSAIATVGSTSGIVTGVSTGSVNIDYTLPSGCMATTPVTVNPLPAGIAGSSSVCIGATTNLTDPTAGGTWSSSTFHATVTPTSGIVTGTTAGSTNIIYTLPTGCTATKAVTIKFIAGKYYRYKQCLRRAYHGAGRRYTRRCIQQQQYFARYRKPGIWPGNRSCGRYAINNIYGGKHRLYRIVTRYG